MHVQSCFLLIKLIVFFFLTFSLPSALLDLKIPNGTWPQRSAILDFSFVALIPCEGYDQRLDINLFNVKVEFWANIPFQKIKFLIETSRIMIRNHLHSQRIKTIKTIAGSSMDFFLIYKCLQLARKKSSCTQQFQTVLIIFPFVCLRRFSVVLPRCGFSLLLTLQLAPDSLQTK